MDLINDLLANLAFILARMTWLDVLDIVLVAAVFFIILQLFRGTQTMVLLRGVLLLLALILLISSLQVLPGFSWLVRTTLPAILLAIPVIFSPEIRRALERLGRAGTLTPADKSVTEPKAVISAIVNAAVRLSERRHGALIVVQRRDSLDEYVKSGVAMDAQVTAELLLQVFYPNTPLHDGAVIIQGMRLVAAACVMPLSSSGVLNRTPDRQMGLRHRAALGISEVSDAVAVVVSEETGSISLVHGGRMIRRLDAERLDNILWAFYHPTQPRSRLTGWLARWFGRGNEKAPKDN